MIPRRFFRLPPEECARRLVGAALVWDGCSGVVVECEAYAAAGDEACHTFRRPSAREFVARQPAGTAYVYLNYGVHWLFNVLVKGDSDGFVLIRALDPRGGLPAMQQRRPALPPHRLCAGPGRLTKALGIHGGHHGLDLCATPGRGFREEERDVPVAAGPRIGISRARELPWRFGWAGHRGLSAPLPIPGKREARPA